LNDLVFGIVLRASEPEAEALPIRILRDMIHDPNPTGEPVNIEQDTSSATQPEGKQRREPLRWVAECVEDLEKGELSYAELAAKYGKSPATIAKIRGRHVHERPVHTKSGPKPIHLRKKLGEGHKALGIRLTLKRAGQTFTEFGAELGVSRVIAQQMEAGVHDFTLTQLLKAKEILGLSLDEMLAPHKVQATKKGAS
jgi:hypothetical protein